MKKFKLVMVALMLSAGALAGCNKDEPKPDPEPEHTHTYSTEWTSDETNHWHAATCGHDVKDGEGAHTFGNDGKCSVCEYYDEGHDDTRVFTDEKLGAFKGMFFNGDSVVTITANGAFVQDGDEMIELKNDTIKGSGYSTVVTYIGPEDSIITLKWKRAAWDIYNFNFMLPTLVVGDEELQLQPSIESAQGWYDGWEGYMDTGSAVYIVTNEFDAEADAFQMYGVLFNYDFIGESFFIKSSFVKIGDKLELALSWFDNEDLKNGYNYDEWNYYLVKDAETGRLNMAYLPEEEGEDPYYAWWARPSFFLGEFLRPSSLDYSLGQIFGDWMYDSYTFWVDEDEKTVSINYGEDLSYVEGYDEKGAFVTVDGAKYRGTSTGITVETTDGVEECPVFFIYSFYNLQWYDYISGANSIAFVLDTDWDTWEYDGYLSIDGEKAEESYLTIVDGMAAIGAKNGQDEYFFLPYDGVDAVLVGKNDESFIYVNSNKLSDFVGSYFDQEFSNFVVTEKEGSLYVKFAAQEFEASLVYTDDYGVVVTFGEDGMLVPLNEEKGLSVAFFGESSAVFLFEKNSVMNALGNWTSGIIDATFNNDAQLTVKFAGQDMNMLGLTALQTEMGDYAPACVFGTRDVQFVATIDTNNTFIYELGIDGSLYFIGSFIRPEVFANFYGEFDYLGEYGKEKVSLSEEGVLTVTTINETGDGIIDQEFDYLAFCNETYSGLESGLEFTFKEVPIDITYDGQGHCSIFTVTFLAKVFFDNQGLFGSSSDSYLSVVDNKIVYNGTKMIVIEFTDSTITGSVNGELATIEFGEGNGTVTVGEAEPVVLAKKEVSVASFACDVKENVGNLGEDIKVTEDGKILAHLIGDSDDAWNEITDYEFCIDEDGNAFIKASYKMAYTYTISLVEGEVVIKGESSLPPIPPPPPLF